MITPEEWNLILEREGLDQFLQARFCNELEDMPFEVYETKNGFLGVIFEIVAPPFPGEQTMAYISSLLTLELPANSVVHFFRFASRDIEAFRRRAERIYDESREKSMRGIDHPQMLQESQKWQWDYLMSRTRETLYPEMQMNYYINNQINLVTVMIPDKNADGDFLDGGTVRSIFSKVYQTLSFYGPRFFSQEKYVNLMGEIFNWKFSPVRAKDQVTPLHDQIIRSDTAVRIRYDGRVQFGEMEKFVTQTEPNPGKPAGKKGFSLFGKKEEEKNKFIPKKHCSILVKKLFPHYLSIFDAANIFMNFFGEEGRIEPMIPDNHFISLVVYIEDPEAKKKEIQDEARWNTHMLSNIGGMAKYAPQLRKKGEEMELAIEMIDRGQIPMKAMWSAGIFSDDETTLDRTITSVSNRLKVNNWEVQEERLISVPVLLYSLPLQFDEIFFKMSQKFSTLYRANAAALAPLYADPKGFGDPVMPLVGRNGQIQGVDLFSDIVDVKNFTIVAPSGKGKSVLTNEIARSYLGVGSYVRILDRGNSYERMVRLFGGEYVKFDEDTCFNFFDGAETDEEGVILDTEVERFIPIVGKMAGFDLNDTAGVDATDEAMKAVVRSYLAEAIRRAAAMGGETPDMPPGMKEVHKALQDILEAQQEEQSKGGERAVDEKLRDLIRQLAPYADKNSSKYRAFNGRSNVNFSKRLVAFEMQSLEPQGAQFKALVVMIIVTQIQREFFHMPRSVRKLFLADEAWDLLRDPVAAKFFSDSSRIVRKHNAAMGIITNSLMDLASNPGTRIFFENSSWRIFFQQDQKALAEARNSGNLIVDDFYFELISSLRTKKRLFAEIMFLTSGNHLSIGRLFLSPELYWLYTSDPEDMEVIQGVQKRYGVTEEVACLAIALSKGGEGDFEQYVDSAIRLTSTYTEEEMADILGELVESA